MKRRRTEASDGAKRFGAWLRRARKVRGITQGELSIRAGVGYSTISYIETGHRDPVIGTVLQLADALGYRMVFVDKVELERRKGGTAGAREGGAGTVSTRASDAAEAWASGRQNGAGTASTRASDAAGATERGRASGRKDGAGPARRDDEEEDG